MKERIAIIDGLRTPFAKAGGPLAKVAADDLCGRVVRELMVRTGWKGDAVDELIVGNVAQPMESANVARIIALKAGLPVGLIASTVHRNCASGMEAITTAGNRILADEAEVIVAAGTESMSNIPLIVGKKMTTMFGNLMKAKTVWQKLAVWSTLRPAHLTPIIGVQVGLTDPVCSLNMGQTAEILARDFHVTRQQQDEYALASHQKALKAWESGRMAEEVMPIATPPYEHMLATDDGPRPGQDLAALAKLKPYFDRVAGTVTVGNACPLTDGAVATLVMRESKARALGLKPLGYLRDYAYAALEGRRMGLGPVHATAKLLKKSGMRFADFELIELNEAFAAQVIACERAFASAEFCKPLGFDAPIGVIDRERLNVNGGAIALGHPVGATGARLVVTLLKELRRRGLKRGLATLCVGGGQGAALALETE
ncbi:MAG TPA: thiolase family protein [Planctomycetota bacterium]|nr:thiolase family protein [Planctomycetota bacterium]